MHIVKQWLAWLSAYPELKYVLQIIGLILLAWLLQRFAITALRRWASRTGNTLDDGLVSLLAKALKPLLVLGVLTASLNLFTLPERFLTVMNRALYLGVVFVVLFFGSRVIQLFIAYGVQKTGGSPTLLDPARFLTRAIFAVLAVMLLLDNLGISLTALWTTLGVGSVAVALALQETLSNFFAGVYLRLDHPIRVGDFVKLESGEEGYVISMGWRSTHIRTLRNYVVVVPNSKLATSTVTNFSKPSEDMALLLTVSAGYEHDPEKVERILVEEATRAVGAVKGLLPEPPPFVRFIPGFGESSLDFTLICRVRSFEDQYLVQHELRKRILKRFQAEGIEIPFPQRTVHVISDGAADEFSANA